MNEIKILFSNKKIRIFIIIVSIVLLYTILGIYNYSKSYYTPDYPMEDISDIFIKEDITDRDYEKIFLNTGVAQIASKELIDSGNTTLLRFLNSYYFKKPLYKNKYIAFPVTANELNEGIRTPLVPLKKGDVLITFNTHTLLWRHGHSAIVVDDKGEEILEHIAVGHKSRISPSQRWGVYPGFMILRYKDSNVAKKAADYARENLDGIDYNVFAGLIDKDKSKNDVVDSSHCSHIVWQAYKAAGYDIDSDKGSIVTPYDMAMCDDFQLVQIFGINPEKYMK